MTGFALIGGIVVGLLIVLGVSKAIDLFFNHKDRKENK